VVSQVSRTHSQLFVVVAVVVVVLVELLVVVLVEVLVDVLVEVLVVKVEVLVDVLVEEVLVDVLVEVLDVVVVEGGPLAQAPPANMKLRLHAFPSFSFEQVRPRSTWNEVLPLNASFTVRGSNKLAVLSQT